MALEPFFWLVICHMARNQSAKGNLLGEALRQLSAEQGLAIEFELDGTFVGSFEDGRIDRTLSVGLLGEWRKELERRAHA